MNTAQQSKPRYELLDGLRGVAAMMVIIYHVFECFPMEAWIIGHGYLAVDFFFILSGFVIGYAYDNRQLTFGAFAKRRLIRLHPMVVFGVIVGLLCFLLQGGEMWDGTKVSVSAIMLAVLLGLFLIPITPGSMGEVRGNGEMFPLNGPHWSLFFEYIGNLAYIIFIRRFSTEVLAIFTAILGILFSWFFINDTVGYGNIGVGWTTADSNFLGGLLRMGFSYSAGLLMSRIFRPARVKGAFWLCAALIVAFLSVPFIGSGESTWVNCLYEVLCVMLVFPLVVWIAASGKTTDSKSTRICSFLGEISYPLYAVHYPTMYLFYHYIGFPETWRTPGECWAIMLALIVGNVAFAYLAMRYYDKPLRRRLNS